MMHKNTKLLELAWMEAGLTMGQVILGFDIEFVRVVHVQAFFHKIKHLPYLILYYVIPRLTFRLSA
jgi:hypothetical protein